MFRQRSFLTAALVFMLIVSGGVAVAEEHTVKVLSGKAEQMRFEPQDLEVKVGDTVTWVNEKSVYHNVRSLKKDVPEGAEPLKSPGLRKEGDKWSYTFKVAGEYDYFCVPHRTMGMVGSVTVVE